VTVLSSKRFSRITLPLLSGFLLALSFPRPGLFPLAWIALIPLFVVIADQGPAKAFLSGWLVGLVYFGGTLYWIMLSLVRHGGLPWLISFLVLFLLVSYLATYIGLFAALFRYAIADKKNAGLFVAPVLWVSLEWAKGRLLSGFPWAGLAYSQTSFLSMIQMADFGGIYIVAFVVVLCNRALYLGFTGNGGRAESPVHIRWQPLAAGCAVFLLGFFYGAFRLSESFEGSETKAQMTIAVIQGNIPQDQKWDRRFQKQTLDTYRRLSTAAMRDSLRKHDLIVWPEAVLPFVFGTEAVQEQGLRDFAADKGVYLLFGAPSIGMSSPGKVSLRNSAYLLSPDSGQAAQQYNKLHLVPFGEYVPFPEFLFFIEKFVEGVADFAPGEDAVVFKVNQARVGTAICFEVIFPEIVRRFVQNGATVMTAITNDAWFGRSAAPDQHFSMTVFRAIEHRIPFARAANTGISGFIDARGRVMRETALFEEATATATLSLRQQTTLYTRWGDFFAAFCAIISISFLCMTWIKRRKKDAC